MRLMAMRWGACTALLLGASCNIPPKDPFAAGEYALRQNDLLRALQAYDAVPVAHERYPDARAAAGDVEQRMRRCHELILEALMLRAEWRDEEALDALRRASQHWPQQPSVQKWIAATEQRIKLFAERDAAGKPAKAETPASPMVEVAKIGEPQLPDAPESGSAGDQEAEVEPVGSSPDGPAISAKDVISQQGQPLQEAGPREAGSHESGSQEPGPQESGGFVEVPAVDVPKPLLPEVSSHRVPDAASGASEKAAQATEAPTPTTGPKSMTESGTVAAGADDENQPTPSEQVGKTRAVVTTKRLPTGEDPVALGLVAVEARLGRGELALAVRDLIELSRRFPEDLRVQRRLSRLLHQRALMNYGQGAVAAAVADWRRVLEIEPGNRVVEKLLQRALAESQAKDS